MSLKGKFCDRPFTTIEPQEKGDVYLCCQHWLPVTIGNLFEQDLDEIWNSQAAQRIRRSILDGTFEYCDRQKCPLIVRDELPDKDNFHPPPWDRLCVQYIQDEQTEIEHPTFYNLCYDFSCNLQCPSCREKKIVHSEGFEYEQILQIHEKIIKTIYQQLESTGEGLFLNVTGSGDPFISRVYWSLLNELDGEKYPALRINIQSNGLLFTPNTWAKMSKIHQNIHSVIVSVDAATSETYGKVRPQSDFGVLTRNIAFMSDLSENNRIKELRLDFTIQRKNYREMPDFIRLAKQYPGVDGVSFGLLTDWKTGPEEEHTFNAVWKSDHPEFEQFLEILKDPIFMDKDYVAMPFSDNRGL